MSFGVEICDVLIAGAGITGASLAFRLAQAGVRVVVVDRAGPAAGATGTSFAYINASGKTPRRYFDLNLAGMAAHHALRDELGDVPWMLEPGRLVWETDPGEARLLDDQIERVTNWGYRAEWLDRQAVAQLEPNLVLEESVERVLLYPGEIAIDAPLAAHSLLTAAVRLGAVALFGAEITGFWRVGGRIAGATIASGETIGAGLVVNCAGAAAGRVAALAGRALPMSPVTGMIVRASGAPGAVSRTIDGPRIQLRPNGRDDGLLLLHLRPEDEALAVSASPGDAAAEMIRRARGCLTNGGKLTLQRWSIEPRPIPADGFTSAGIIPSLPGYGEIVTHSGVTLGPLLGELIAAEIVSGTPSPLLEGFRPERFSLAGAGEPAPELQEG